MRIDVKKFLFIGLDEDREEFFKKAQDLGIIHFIETGAPKGKEIPQEIQQFVDVIKILRKHPVVKQQQDGDPQVLVSEILQLHRDIERLEEEKRLLRIDVSRIEVFGDFSLEDLHTIQKLGHRVIQFFCAKKDALPKETLPPELIFIKSDYGLDFFVSIATESKSYEKMTEMKIEQSLGAQKKRLKEVEVSLNAWHEKLKEQAKFLHFLKQAFIDVLNHYQLASVRGFARHTMEGSLFAVESWIPVNKIEDLNQITKNLSVHKEEISLESKDAVPTYLENKGAAKIGEDLISIYDTPSTSDLDPSMWVLCAFTLFFAIIVGDGGYGSVYLGIALYLRYKYPHLQGLGKRLLNLMTLLCVACIVWGILTTSFFGISIDVNNPIRKLSLAQWLIEKKVAYHVAQQDKYYMDWLNKWPEINHITDPKSILEKSQDLLSDMNDKLLLELALFIGVIHVMISLIRYGNRNYAAAGWVLFLIGSYLYFPYYLNTPSVLNYLGGIDLQEGGRIGFYLIFAGIGLATAINIFQNKWLGLPDTLTYLIQIFSDVLSYLRLYALGLSGSLVSSTINSLIGTIPFPIALVIMILAHGLNMVLGIMSGVIHGLRLNFLEWYHYSFEGGGKKFQPLKLIKKE